MDTEGDELPAGVAAFFATGTIDQARLAAFLSRLTKRGIECQTIDAGDGAAGSIRVIKRGAQEKDPTQYRMQVNRNHPPNVQFATLAHELGHLFLGHLGPDKVLNVPERRSMEHRQVELEAESVSFLVCARNGVTSKAEAYLASYMAQNTTIDEIDLYQIVRAAGQIETLLGLTAPTKYK
jgi:hypothetical protein